MTEDTERGRREKFEEEAEQIRNSDRDFSEKTNAISNARDKYYSSIWEKVEGDLERMDDTKRYTIILGSGFLYGLFFWIIFGDFGMFIIGGTIGILFASSFTTKPGVRILNELAQQSEAANGSQRQTTNKPSKKTICSVCGWQNPISNNFCNDCGEELSN